MSHTVTVKIELNDTDALAAAVAQMGGTCLGQGTHKLYSYNSATGFGFRLPGWHYPLVLKADNTLAFDNFRGHWGNVKDLDTLKAHYATARAQVAAEAQGWATERQQDGSLMIYHPDGGTMTVYGDGTVDCNGFVGQGCDAAAMIENAIGTQIERNNKAEYFEQEVHIRS